MTVIDKANALVEEHGKEFALTHFKNKIIEMGEPTTFEQICQKSGWLIAIKHINGEITKKGTQS